MNRSRCSLIVLLFLFAVSAGYAQLDPGWINDWKGVMQISRAGKTVDSVSVTLTIKPSGKEGTYIWRMEYHSATRPMVKDYTLRVIDAVKGLYVTDEGEGVELSCSLYGAKLYSVFEVQKTMLTATYELRGSELVFEVTAGKTGTATGGGVTNYSVTSLQRVVLRRAEAVH